MFEITLPWLLLILPLPFLMRWVPSRMTTEPALRVPFFQQIASMNTHVHVNSRRRTSLIILWLIWLLCVFAAAGPRWVGESESLPHTGRDLMLAVDISGSMVEQDMQPQGVVTMQFKNSAFTRLDAVKAVVGDFATRRIGDRLGLILFADHAYLQAPLTHDNKTVNQLLQESEIGFAGKLTAIGDAIGLGIKRLRTKPDDGNRRLILLTDGENNAGITQPLKAAERAAAENIKIYTIGFGAKEMIVQTHRGPARHNPSKDLDENTLQQIAQITGGQYFRAHSTEELENIHLQLDALEPIELDALKIRPIKSLFYWPLILALCLSVLMALVHLLPYRLQGEKK